ncbi:MAG: DUF885 family protein [Calditrichaeota bacterium]|nr:MAG: DUF885 family protein [Calditrichota bacterium]
MLLLLRILFFLMPAFCRAQTATNLQQLGQEFWQWRFTTQPATSDDIQRVERPDSWAPDFSPYAIKNQQEKYQDFRSRLDNLSKTSWSLSDSVDYLCLRSAIERVNWELNVLRHPSRNPDFYVHQTLGALFELLIINQPYTEQRIENIIHILQSFPKTIAAAKINLTEPVAEFAEIALSNLKDAASRLTTVQDELIKTHKIKNQKVLQEAIKNGAAALVDYEKWINEKLPEMNQDFSCGREAYVYFLENIALIPQTPEALLQQGRIAFNRSVAFETMEKTRNQHLPEDKIFATIDEEIEKAIEDEIAIRTFLEEKDIMSVPGWLQHYHYAKTPPEVKAIGMGVFTDFTSETRLQQNASRYVPEPDADLPYFYRTMAQDPRPIIVHEGVPGHFFQLALSWKNANPLRRRFVDSGPIEGIGLYVEEMLLQFGLFDNKPKTREIIYNFMRLRALRVEIDIRLALGTFTIEEAGNYLAETIPMDKETAVSEAGFFAYNPGQAITYQIGKLQILNFLGDAKIKLCDKFNLRDFHDYLIVNGNVPISLQRWEYLGLRDDVGVFFE